MWKRASFSKKIFERRASFSRSHLKEHVVRCKWAFFVGIRFFVG